MSGIASWYAIHRRILRFAANLPVNRYMRIRGEDVLNDPDLQLREIAGWLDVSTEDSAIEAMKHPEASPFASLQTADSGIVGGNDPAFLNAPTPPGVDIPSNLEPPPGWTADLSIWKMVTELANRLGYF